MSIDQIYETANKACVEAGIKILEIYNRPEFEIQIKENNSPLTEADQAGHEVIMSYLKNTGIPVLSEEGKDIPYSERKSWSRFWLVDPLDGTKEFIKRNGEFTVNIALIENGKPVFGSVYVPVTATLYHGGTSYSAVKEQDGVRTELQVNPRGQSLSDKLKLDALTVVASRSHNSPETQELLDSLQNPGVVSMGSSLKFMALAEGKADIYPRYAPTMEWDTGAAHAVIASLGYRVHIKDSDQALAYNKENLLNPFFICF